MIHMEKIFYSSCNEDANSEFKALQIGNDDKILCITGSGARVLDLLTQTPKSIYAVDCNLSQQNLLKLKAAAIQKLPYQEFKSFLGLSKATPKERLEIYHELKDLLEETAQQFWDKRFGLIAKGVIFQGEWECYFRKNAQLTYLIRQAKQQRLFQFDNLEEQASYWKKTWANGFWRFLVRCCSNRFVWHYILKDPGFFLYVPHSFNMYNYINSCFNRASENFLFKRSHFANLLFWGKWHPDFLPPHLQAENYTTLKNNIGKINYINTHLLNALQQKTLPTINKFSLSDFASYTSPSDYQTTWEILPNIASSGALICERQFLVKRNVTETSKVKRDYDLEKILEKHDQSIFYSFVIAKIN